MQTNNVKSIESGLKWGVVTERSKKENFSADDIIDAYESGKKDGINYYTTTFKKELKSNLQKAIKTIEDFYKKSLDGKSHFVMLRISSINYFDVIAALDRDIYFNDDKCKPIYEESFSLSRSNRNINISFIPSSGKESVNLESLIADDYLIILHDDTKQS
jgi:hypothetical protein